MRKVKLIFNPASDRGRSGERAADLQTLVDQFGGATWAGTEYPGHATLLAEQAAAEGTDIVVAFGGDGTVNEVANGLLNLPAELRPKLGVVPIGSGNDFAYNTALPSDPVAALQRVFLGEPKMVDAAVITDQTGRRRYWVNTCGMLMTAAIGIQARRVQNLYGFSAYLLAVLRSIADNYQTTRFTLTIDDQPSHDLDLLLFAIGNGAREGGGFFSNPTAQNNDGVLNYFLTGPISRFKMLQVLPTVMNGTHSRFPFVRFGTFRHIHIRANRAVPVHVDGEIWGPYEADLRELTVSVLPQALQVLY
jgi:diacylglycerol kinase (ATP)